jgi:hypothetical protein
MERARTLLFVGAAILVVLSILYFLPGVGLNCVVVIVWALFLLIAVIMYVLKSRQ